MLRCITEGGLQHRSWLLAIVLATGCGKEAPPPPRPAPEVSVHDGRADDRFRTRRCSWRRPRARAR